MRYFSPVSVVVNSVGASGSDGPGFAFAKLLQEQADSAITAIKTSEPIRFQRDIEGTVCTAFVSGWCPAARVVGALRNGIVSALQFV